MTVCPVCGEPVAARGSSVGPVSDVGELGAAGTSPAEGDMGAAGTMPAMGDAGATGPMRSGSDVGAGGLGNGMNVAGPMSEATRAPSDAWPGQAAGYQTMPQADQAASQTSQTAQQASPAPQASQAAPQANQVSRARPAVPPQAEGTVRAVPRPVPSLAKLLCWLAFLAGIVAAVLVLAGCIGQIREAVSALSVYGAPQAALGALAFAGPAVVLVLFLAGEGDRLLRRVVLRREPGVRTATLALVRGIISCLMLLLCALVAVPLFADPEDGRVFGISLTASGALQGLALFINANAPVFLPAAAATAVDAVCAALVRSQLAHQAG